MNVHRAATGRAAARREIVARVCEALWHRRPWLDSEMAAERLLDDPEWCSDGYDGDQPWSRARRYVREYLRGLKDEGALEVETEGSAHYNRDGTHVRYSLARRYDAQARCVWCSQVWPEAGLEVVDEAGGVACDDCRMLARLEAQLEEELQQG